jgi:hypothetical protein
MNKKTWYTVKDRKIDRVQITRENEKPVPANLDWKQSPSNNILHPETTVERYDDNMRYLTDEEWLKKQGRKDPRGRWYNKETRDTKLVYGLEETVDEIVWTQAAPLDNESHQKFDDTKKNWVVDNEKKKRAEKEVKLSELKSEIETAERKQYRSWKAIEQKTATEHDIKFFNQYETIIEKTRPLVKALEDELKESA